MRAFRVIQPLSVLALGLGLLMPFRALLAQTGGFPLVASFSADEIGADPTTWVVVQDKDGILHFGGKDLVSYDGDRWHTTPMNGAHAIRGLDFSATGDRLWAGAIGEIGWFDRSTNGRWIYHSLNLSIPEEHRTFGEIWNVFATSDGAIFVADEKIMRWNGKEFRIWPLPLAGSRRLRALRVDDTIFIQATGLYTLGNNGPELFMPAAELDGMRIFWMERRPTGWLLITNKGLFTLSDGRIVAVEPQSSAVIQSLTPTHVTRLADGRLAVGTLRGGIVILNRNGGIDRTVGQPDGLPTQLINWLFVDRDRQLWATSYTHISRISISSASSVFDQRSSLPPKPFHQITGDQRYLYAATDDGVYRLDSHDRHFALFEPLHEHISALQWTSRGLIAAGLQAVKRVSGDEATVIYSTPHDTFSVHETSDRLLVADGRSVVEFGSNEQSRILISGLPDNAWSIARERNGRIWLGTETHGVLFADPAPAAEVGAKSAATILKGVQSDGNAIVRETPDGSVYLFYSQRAWLRDSEAGGGTQAVENYPARKLVAASETTSDGNVWLIHTGAELAPCVGVVTKINGIPVWRSHSVEGLANVGVPQTIFAQRLNEQTTILWIGGTNGILRHVVAHGLSAPQPRPPLLRAVARNSDDAPQAITGPLPYSTRSIEFEFAEPDFTRRAALRLQTRFVGVDPDWVPADSTSRRTLTAVRDGTYTFQVRAVAETGIASIPASVTFEVLPPWYRTTSALIGGLFGLIPLGYGFYRLRVRALRRHNAELEEKVHRRTEELERASAAKTEFVANMSHDIRNPLNGIVGLTLALDDTRLEKRQREIVATLRECATYLSTLVDDVLDFASIEAGRVELRTGPFAPHELLRSIVTTLKADTAERGALLLVEADPSLPASVLGDAGRVQQILVNYVSNALKYAGGHIRLSACVPADTPGEIEFSVADEGPGISDPEKATLFTKFNRLSHARREDIPGSGLGLAACRLLADHMGGSVGVDSEPGHGARFYLRLPLSIAPIRAEAPPQDLPNTTVLVVEDTDYNAWAASAVLAKLGLTCERARTGAEALRLFRERRFNVVLLDRNLPDLDGTEVARQMRAMEADGLQAVLLAVTAYCTAEDRALCLKAGMDAFVGKPLTPEKLRKVLLATGRRQLAAASVHVSPEVPPASTLDLSLLKYLSNGTSEGLDAEIARYIARLDDCLAEITTAAEATNFPGLALAAHGLQGHAKLVGGAHLAELSLQLEHTAAGRIESGLHEQLRQITAEMHALKAQLRHHRSSVPRA